LRSPASQQQQQQQQGRRSQLHRSASGAANSRDDGAWRLDGSPQAPTLRRPELLRAARVAFWVGPKTAYQARTPASDTSIKTGFPPALTAAGDRFELLEALLVHGVIYAASDEGLLANPATHYRPAHRAWGFQGPLVAVSLERLWAQLPRPMREWLEEQGSGGGGGGGGEERRAGSRRGGEVVLGEFITGRCHAVRLVEEARGRAPSAALGHAWLGALLRHHLFARLVGELQAEAGEEADLHGPLREVAFARLVPPTLALYMRVRRGGRACLG
jgi:hypothetical protein